MMKGAYPRPVVNIIEAIQFGDPPFDKNEFRRRTLDVVTENLRLDRALFVLADETSRFTDFMVKDIDEVWVKRYKEYYRQHDPFELIDRKYEGKLTLRLEELVPLPSFRRSEYYNDFLLPQRIHHKTTSYLVSGRKALGLIGFFRSRCSPPFSEGEIEMISTISPFITQGLEHADLRCRQRLQSDLLKILKDDNSWGLLVLDDSMDPIFMNENAGRICADLSMGRPFRRSSRQPLLPPMLLEDCRALKERCRESSAENRIGAVARTIYSQRSQKRYELRSKRIDRENCPENCRLYTVSINQVSDDVQMKRERLDEIYGLTGRESDILFQLSRGHTNAEIARELCVCEITVKKHIQRLFEKVGVNNRTALVHRTLIEPGESA